MTKLCRVLLCGNNAIRNIETPSLKLGYSLFLNFFVSLRKSCFPRSSPGYLLTAAGSPALPRLSSFFLFFLELDVFWFLLHHYKQKTKKNTRTPARKLGLILHNQLLCKLHTAGSAPSNHTPSHREHWPTTALRACSGLFRVVESAGGSTGSSWATAANCSQQQNALWRNHIDGAGRGCR